MTYQFLIKVPLIDNIFQEKLSKRKFFLKNYYNSAIK